MAEQGLEPSSSHSQFDIPSATMHMDLQMVFVPLWDLYLVAEMLSWKGEGDIRMGREKSFSIREEKNNKSCSFPISSKKIQ